MRKTRSPFFVFDLVQNPRQMRIAVTGGIASGKSTVVAELGSCGFKTSSADAIAAEVRADPGTRRRVATELGLPEDFDDGDLRQVVSDSPAARSTLNSILHPAIFRGMTEADAEVFEVPLLFEACIQRHFQYVVVTACGVDIQLERLISRGADTSLAEGLIRSQLPEAVKCALADQVLRTDFPLESVLAETRRLAQFLR